MFQSTPPRGGRPNVNLCVAWSYACFNPRPRAGGDTAITAAKQTWALFQSTPPRGGRHTVHTALNHVDEFQSTPPRGGRLITQHFKVTRVLFQSTPPRGGRRNRFRGRFCRENVSIHAPARGATRTHDFSSHTPSCFNPRPRAGGDVLWSLFFTSLQWFQSTPPRGGRPGQLSYHGGGRWFQSTPPRGGRRVKIVLNVLLNSFNPRPRAGGDLCRCCLCYFDLSVSIHAPARGATVCFSFLHLRPTFQSTPPRGGRL